MGISVCLFGIGYRSIKGRPTSSQSSLNWLNERNIQFITGIWVIWIFALCQPILAADVVEHALGSLPALGSTARGYYVSPDKSDVAVAMRNGTSEFVASLAGPGPPFSRILPRSIRWIEDRIVYIAANGGDYFLVDGKSKIKLPGTPVETAFDRPLATEDRRHYVLFVAQKNGIAAWVNGKPSKPQYERILFVPKQHLPRSSLFYSVQKDCTQRVQGHIPSSYSRWTSLSGISSSPDGKNVFVWGETKGRHTLQKNGKTIFDGAFTKFQSDLAGEYWAALLDEGSENGDRSALIVNGKIDQQIEAPPLLQELYVAPAGKTWAWLTFNGESSAAVLRRPGVQDATIAGYSPESFVFSGDGQRTAYRIEENKQFRWIVDGAIVDDKEFQQSRAIRLASNVGFAYIAISAARDAEWVTSHLGVGPAFNSIGDLHILPSGIVSYTAFRDGKHFLVINQEVTTIPADSLLSGSLSLSEKVNEVSVLGLRGRDLIKFSISVL